MASTTMSKPSCWGRRPDREGHLGLSDCCERADQLYQEWGPVVYRRCLRLLRNRTAAARATQAVFIKLLRNPDRFEVPEAALPWAYRVAGGHCRALLRRRPQMGAS